MEKPVGQAEQKKEESSNMEELARKIEQVLNQFIQEERGNRLSQFAWSALANIVLNTIRSYKPIENTKKVENKVEKK